MTKNSNAQTTCVGTLNQIKKVNVFYLQMLLWKFAEAHVTLSEIFMNVFSKADWILSMQKYWYQLQEMFAACEK